MRRKEKEIYKKPRPDSWVDSWRSSLVDSPLSRLMGEALSRLKCTGKVHLSCFGVLATSSTLHLNLTNQKWELALGLNTEVVGYWNTFPMASMGTRWEFEWRSYEYLNTGTSVFASKSKIKDFGVDSRSDHPNWSTSNIMSLNTLIYYIRNLQIVPTLSEQNSLFLGSVSSYRD